VIFVSLQREHDATVTKILDAGSYDAAQTVTLKLPMSVPYMQDNEDFVRVDGVIEHEGEHYRLVKQKYTKDTLTVICIHDVERKKITNDMANYVKSFTDKAPGHNNSGKQVITFIKDFLPHYIVVTSLSLGWESNVQHQSFPVNMIASFEASVIHPPENLA